MKVNQITLTYGRTEQLRKYQPSKFDLSVTVTPEEGEGQRDIINKASKFLHDEIAMLFKKERDYLKSKGLL